MSALPPKAEFCLAASCEPGMHATPPRDKTLSLITPFYEPDLTSNPDSPFVRDGSSQRTHKRDQLCPHFDGSLASAFFTSDLEIRNCRAIRDGVKPALKAARIAFSFP